MCVCGNAMPLENGCSLPTLCRSRNASLLSLSLFPFPFSLLKYGSIAEECDRRAPPHFEGSSPFVPDRCTRRRRAARRSRGSGSIEIDAWIRALREDAARDSVGV